MNINDFEFAKQILIRQMPHQPKGQVLQQLSIVLERLKFIPDAADLLQHPDQQQVQSSLSFLFQQDISADMYHFLSELHEKNLGLILIGEEGSALFKQCQEYLDGLSEIRVVTAMEMTAGFQQQLAVQLDQGSPETTRVVFEVLPSLIGGCLIVDASGRTTDYSLRTNIAFFAHRFLERKLEEITS